MTNQEQQPGADILPSPSSPTASPGQTWPRRIWNVGKWLVVVLAFVYLWRTGMVSRQMFRLSRAAAWAAPAAVFCLGLSAAAMGVRLHRLLRCLGAPSTLAGQCRISFSALLAQQIGSEAGYDAMRIVGSKVMGGKGSDILAAIIVDRLLGTMALTVLAATGLALFWSDSGWLPAAAVMAAAIVAAPLLMSWWHGMLRANPASRLARLPGAAFAAEVGGAVRIYRGHVRTLAGLFLLALATHGVTFAALYFCGLSLVGVDLRPGEALTGGALSFFTGALPLPMAGLGVGEAAFGEVVAVMRGSGKAADFAPVFLINRLLTLLLGAVAWLWLAASTRKGKTS